MLRQPYSRLIDIKCWADCGLHDTVAQNRERLSDQDVGLLRLVLDHIHTVDRIFQAHLLGRPHGFAAARSETLPELETLRAGALEVDGWYANYARALSAQDLAQPVDFVFTSGKPARMTRAEILLHVCLHGTYHRGNAGALLQLRGLSPSRDSITDYLEDAA